MLFLIGFFGSLSALTATPGKIRTLYNSLDPTSVSEHLAFYELYPNSLEGKKAIRQAWELLAGPSKAFDSDVNRLPLSESAIEALVGLVNKQPGEETPLLEKDELRMINKIAARTSQPQA